MTGSGPEGGWVHWQRRVREGARGVADRAIAPLDKVAPPRAVHAQQRGARRCGMWRRAGWRRAAGCDGRGGVTGSQAGQLACCAVAIPGAYQAIKMGYLDPLKNVSSSPETGPAGARTHPFLSNGLQGASRLAVVARFARGAPQEGALFGISGSKIVPDHPFLAKHD